jgi:glucose-1-phosphate thymidylyltransferase
MIYYPLATLCDAGITDILLISSPEDIGRFEALLGDGSQWGISLTYAIQTAPRGIAEAFIVGADFIGGESVALILGDNLFYGEMGIESTIDEFDTGAVIYGYPVSDPMRYGVVEVDEAGNVLGLVEKPARPRSNLAVPGLYLYDNSVVEIATSLEPSPRGELEITDLNMVYLERGALRAVRIGRGVAWLDSGTHDSLLEAANFIATIEHRQGIKVACIEEIAHRRGYIDDEQLRRLTEAMPGSGYRAYLEALLEDLWAQ